MIESDTEVCTQRKGQTKLWCSLAASGIQLLAQSNHTRPAVLTKAQSNCQLVRNVDDE